MYNLVICDDNIAAINNVKTIVETYYPNQFDIKTAQNVNDIDVGSIIDILLMDIELNSDTNGIEVSSSLLMNQSNMQVIFISSYHQYAEEIFNVCPVYYVQKPVNADVLKKAIDRALTNLKEENDAVFKVQNSGEVLTIRVKDILFVESQLRKVKLVTANREIEFYDKLDNVENKMNELGACFIKIHKSYIVNAEHVVSLVNSSATLDNDIEIPVSKTYYQQAKMSYLKYLTEH